MTSVSIRRFPALGDDIFTLQFANSSNKKNLKKFVLFPLCTMATTRKGKRADLDSHSALSLTNFYSNVTSAYL